MRQRPFMGETISVWRNLTMSNRGHAVFPCDAILPVINQSRGGMKSTRYFLFGAVLTGFVLTGGRHSMIFAQGTAFTYQGRLNDAGKPANGIYDVRFTAFDALTNGTAWGGFIAMNVGVTDGLFTAVVNMGAGVFDGSDRWLQLSVRTNGGTTFSQLLPRQRISAVPYA